MSQIVDDVLRFVLIVEPQDHADSDHDGYCQRLGKVEESVHYRGNEEYEEERISELPDEDRIPTELVRRQFIISVILQSRLRFIRRQTRLIGLEGLIDRCRRNSPIVCLNCSFSRFWVRRYAASALR